MARVSLKQNSFNRGQISEKLWDRQDLELYYSAAESVINYVVDGRGILEHRPGTRYVDNTKSDAPAWLIGFEYDVEQSYMLAWGQNYVRPYANYGLVLDGGLPSETATPYSAEQAAELSTFQDNDVLFLAHGAHAPARLQRDTVNTFSIADFDTIDGPYLEQNTDPDHLLEVISGGAPANQGRVTFSTIPVDLIVGSVIRVWDGAVLRSINVLSIDAANNRAETNWLGGAIATTEAWSYDNKAPAAGETIDVEGVAPGTTTATLQATGFAPFTADDIGRWVRILYQNPSAPVDADIGERFNWSWFKIVSVTDGDTALIEWSGGSIPQTADWRLGAFYVGNYPTAVTIHGGRLAFGMPGVVYLSRPQAFNDFTPTNADTTVDPNHAITVPIDGNKVFWLKTLGFQLVVGSPSGIGAIQSSSFGEALTPGTAIYLPQDSRGAGQVAPNIVADSIIFAHSTRRQLMGTYYRNTGGVDKLGAQDLSSVADDMTLGGIRQIAWQDYPHSINWLCQDDGSLNAITIQPEEKVQAWHRHQLGGRFIAGGRVLHPQVESIATIRSPDGTRNDVWFVVRRTINGVNVRFIEAMTDYWTKGTDPRDSWFLDAALRYNGNVDPAATLTITVGDGPNEAWHVETTPECPPFVVGPFSIYDGTRWHRGEIVSVDGDNDFEWWPSAPNSQPAAVDGRRWFYNATDALWVQVQPTDPDADSYFNPSAPIYSEPQQTIALSQWAAGRTSLAGLDHLGGETVQGLLDGISADTVEVTGSTATWEGAASVVLLGLYADAEGKLLSVEAGSQTGSAQDKQRPVYEVVFNVWETYGLETGTGEPSGYKRTFEQFEPFVFPPVYADGEPPPLFSGTKRMQRDEQSKTDAPKVAWRQRLPLPSFIRSVLVRLNTSDGR
jgi:hypothetical protein